MARDRLGRWQLRHQNITRDASSEISSIAIPERLARRLFGILDTATTLSALVERAWTVLKRLKFQALPRCSTRRFSLTSKCHQVGSKKSIQECESCGRVVLAKMYAHVQMVPQPFVPADQDRADFISPTDWFRILGLRFEIFSVEHG